MFGQLRVPSLAGQTRPFAGMIIKIVAGADRLVAEHRLWSSVPKCVSTAPELDLTHRSAAVIVSAAEAPINRDHVVSYKPQNKH